MEVFEIFVQISTISGPIIRGMFGLWQTIHMISPLHLERCKVEAIWPKTKICCSGRAHLVPRQVAPFSFFFTKLNYGVTWFETVLCFCTIRGLISFVGIIFSFWPPGKMSPLKELCKIFFKRKPSTIGLARADWQGLGFKEFKGGGMWQPREHYL